MIKERHGKTFGNALKQGKMDEQMIGLCSFVAETPGFYTSSCCSGRIILLEKNGEAKNKNAFHRKWHRTVSAKELIEGVEENKGGVLWLKLDPFILHIGCKSIRGANSVLEAMKKAGVKRGGIMVAQKDKFLIELQGTETMALPIKENGKQLAEKVFIEKLLEKANPLLEKNYARLRALENEFRKTLK
ncbi:MAG: hypothetical protein AABW99_00405 [archaeon]